MITIEISENCTGQGVTTVTYAQGCAQFEVLSLSCHAGSALALAYALSYLMLKPCGKKGGHCINRSYIT